MSDLPQLAPATRIVDSVQDTLRDAIFGGALRAGEQLSVPELARRLNVSRSPVREAVLGLVAQGLAVEQPRRGVVVATIETPDLVAIHEVREFLEAGAARLCARRIDKAAVEGLRRIVADQKRAVKNNDAAGYFRTNSALHGAIAAAAGNARLAQILRHPREPDAHRARPGGARPAPHARGLRRASAHRRGDRGWRRGRRRAGDAGAYRQYDPALARGWRRVGTPCAHQRSNGTTSISPDSSNSTSTMRRKLVSSTRP